MTKEGLPFVISAMSAAVAVMAVWLFTDGVWILVVGLVLVAIALFFVYFFRDPERATPEGTSILVSPADGKIMAIKRLESHPFIGAPVVQVSIFLSVFDVHINRIPMAGAINYIKYQKGKFIEAFKEESSEVNEQNEIGLTTPDGQRLIVKQIAGILARRIVCYLKEGQKVKAGERFGMIRFGSRTDLIMPAGTKIDVRKGQHVRGGLTIIARLPIAQMTSPATADTERSDA